MVRRTTGIALLAILTISSLLATADAFDTARKLRDRALNGRVKRNHAHASLQALARSGQYSVSQMHAVLDHIMARRSGFEGYEHAYGSGYDLASGDANAIKFKLIDKHGAIVDQTTADKVLLSQDNVDFSYSEMTAVAGDYWSVKDANKNIICNLPSSGATKTTTERTEATQAQRFATAFNDMWHNPDYGHGGKLPKYGADGKELSAEAKLAGWMPHLEEQLRQMLTKEKAGVDKEKTDGAEIHPGSKYYEGSRPSAWGTITQMASEGWHAQSQKLNNVNAIGEGNWRALQYNDDHFWKCAQDTYKFGHKEAVKTAHAAGKTYADLVARKVAKDAFATTANSLIRAYAMDGFVSHFLSDQFSSGHLRTPRVELRTACDGVSDGAKEAGLTANVMHDEDNWNCVLVKNKLGNLWWACGDHRFFDQENAMNRRMLRDAIAASVKEVSDAFEAGVANKADPTLADGWVAAGINHVGSTELLSRRQAAENTCPLFRIHGSELQIRTSARTALPRPTKATTNAWGSSLRWKMKSDMFPAFEDLSTVRDMGQSDAEFKTAQGNTYDGTECSAYRAFTSRRALGSDDCCAVAGRSTPVFVADSSAYGDTEVKLKWAASAHGTNKDKRVSYVNECYVTQNAVSTGNAIASGAKTVASAAVSGAKAVGGAVVDGAKAVGSAAVDGLVAYGEMMQHMGGLIY